MLIRPVGNSYNRLETYKKSLKESEQLKQSGRSEDSKVGFDKGQLARSGEGFASVPGSLSLWEELSAAGVENFNHRLTNTEPRLIQVSAAASPQNIEVQQDSTTSTLDTTPTASAEELLAIDTMLSNPDVQTMMAEQTTVIPEPSTPAEFALIERYGERRFEQLQRYDNIISTVSNDYQAALASAQRGNGSSGGGPNESGSYTTGTYWDVTHGRGKNGETTSTFNISRFNSAYRQRDTPSARLYNTLTSSFNIVEGGGKTEDNGPGRIVSVSGEFVALDLDDLPGLHDQEAIFVVEGLGWATEKDNVVDENGGLFGPVGALISNVGGHLSDAVNAVGGAVNDGLDFLNEEIISPVISAIPVIGEPINDYIVQPVFGIAELAVTLGTNSIDFAIDTTTNLGAGVADVLSHLATGDISGALSSASQTISTLGGDLVGFAVETGAFVLKSAALAFNTIFSTSETRGLLPEEREYLETIFGNSLDYDEIEIQIGGTIESAFNLRAHAIGNTIYMPESNFTDGVLTESGLDLLAHEAAHVWQYQNDGANYIEEAVFSYFDDWRDDSNDAYDFTTAIENMTPWDEMTPDHQAEIAMVIGEALEMDASEIGLLGQNREGVLTIKHLSDAINAHNVVGPDLGVITRGQLAYLQNIQQLLLKGEV